MAFEILNSELPLAIHRLVEVFDNPGACRFHSGKVCIYILHEYREGLGVASGLLWAGTSRPRAVEHDPRCTEVHLSALDGAAGLAVSEMLGKTEGGRQPVDRTSDVGIGEVR